MRFFREWRKRREQDKAQKEFASKKLAEDAYAKRLRNSYTGYRGHRHSGDGPFLDIDEVIEIIGKELRRVTRMPSTDSNKERDSD
ncbi:MAG: hypothetical protein R3332_00290 [Pseudohongiellaceae bacterium]|nr:hypothetical protein [Pseudohongiellaceae bacterium]